VAEYRQGRPMWDEPNNSWVVKVTIIKRTGRKEKFIGAPTAEGAEEKADEWIRVDSSTYTNSSEDE
jgi:hypothetical protein